MTARDAISPLGRSRKYEPDGVSVDPGMHLLDLLPRLLDSPSGGVEVAGAAGFEGVVDRDSMLRALGRMLVGRPDASIIELECAPADYSASHIARAVEDADVHLTDLLTSPAEGGMLQVTLRVRCDDPSPVAHNLERYGYTVKNMYPRSDASVLVAAERLLALQALINV